MTVEKLICELQAMPGYLPVHIRVAGSNNIDAKTTDVGELDFRMIKTGADHNGNPAVNLVSGPIELCCPDCDHEFTV